jgi:SAM-dependent methyltransferase
LLDGLIAANSIHFQTDTVKVCKHLAQYLKPNGRFIVVEYNVDHGNMWVPYPFSFSSFHGFAQQAGLTEPELLAAVPSRFLNEIYASLAFKKT